MAIKERQNEILNALSKVNVFSENGSILPWSSNVWKEITNELNRYKILFFKFYFIS